VGVAINQIHICSLFRNLRDTAKRKL